jgi:uncharacterized protein (TIGR03067 family)
MDMARMIAVVAALALVAPAAWADERSDSKGASKLIGTWKVTSAEKNGKTETATTTKGKQVKIARDTITCFDTDGKAEMVASYTIDTSTTPWRIDLTCTEGEHKGKKLKGIVRLEDDTLKVCYAKPDETAPTSFKTSEGQRCFTAERSKR